jgi:hypothetical protein
MRRLGVVAIVFVGLLALTASPSLLNHPLSAIRSDSPSVALMLFAFLPAALSFAGGLFLIIRRHELAAAWFDESPVDVVVDSVSVLRLVFIVTGVLILIQGAAALATSIATTAVMAANGGPAPEPGGLGGLIVSALPVLVFTAVTAGLAWLLVIKSGALAQWLLRPRQPGPPRPAPLPTCPSCEEPYDPSDYVGGSTRARCAKCGERLPSDGA